MTNCVCGDPVHDDDCRCGCTIAEEDDGTPTHSSCLTVDWRNPANQYDGRYKTTNGYSA